MPRLLRKTLVDDDSREIRIEHVSAEGVLEASDKHRFVDEGVERAAQPAPFSAEILPVRRRYTCDNQELEIRAMRFRSAERRRQQVGRSMLAIVMNIPIARMLAERFGHQRLQNPRCECRSRRSSAGGRSFLQGCHQAKAGISVKFLRHFELSEQVIEFVAIARAVGPGLRGIHQKAPMVGSRTGSREELVDPLILALFFLRHRSLPRARVGRDSVGIGEVAEY